MALVPAGKRRVMVAQQMQSVQPDMDLGGMSVEDAESLTGGAVGEDQPSSDPTQPDPTQMGNPEDESPEGIQQEVDKAQAGDENSQPNLTKFVFDFLTRPELGYPPRRLQEFKSQFVKENGGSDGTASVEITIPDQVYSKPEMQIPKPLLKEMVQGIEQKFSLFFESYRRENERLTLNFTSNDPRADQMADMGPGDILDKVYGAPKGKGGSQPRQAESIHEMIKAGKEDLVAYLKQALGGKS